MISLASGSGGRDSRGVSLKSLKEVCIFLLLYLMILPQFFFHLAIGHESSLGVYWNRISSVFILISAFFRSAFAIDKMVSRISLYMSSAFIFRGLFGSAFWFLAFIMLKRVAPAILGHISLSF